MRTRVTPRGALLGLPSWAACSSWVAAFCTCSMAELDGLRWARSTSRTFCVAAGRVSIRLLASSLSAQAAVPRPPNSPVSSRPAAAARGRRRRSSRSTSGLSA